MWHKKVCRRDNRGRSSGREKWWGRTRGRVCEKGRAESNYERRGKRSGSTKRMEREVDEGRNANGMKEGGRV